MLTACPLGPVLLHGLPVRGTLGRQLQGEAVELLRQVELHSLITGIVLQQCLVAGMLDLKLHHPDALQCEVLIIHHSAAEESHL